MEVPNARKLGLVLFTCFCLIRRTQLYQNSQTLTHAAGVLPGHPLQKRTEVQWDIGTALGADDGADESTSPQVGITPQQAEQIRQHVNRSADSAITGQRFDL